jgi:type II secretory pathway component PulK
MIAKTSRPGVALIMVIVCLAFLAIMIAAVVRHGLDQKRYLDQRTRRAQAYWLAQAGIEHAAARLLSGGKSYTGEVLQILPQSEVRIRVESRQDRPDTFQMTSEATYPKGELERASSSVSRTFRLKREGGKTQLLPAD